LMLYLMARGPGRSWGKSVLACVLAVAIVGGHRAFPLTGDYSKHVWSFVTATWEPK
jgi:hypothetical protein